MDLVDEMEEGEGVDLSGAGRCPTYIDTSDCPIFAQDDRATR